MKADFFTIEAREGVRNLNIPTVAERIEKARRDLALIIAATGDKNEDDGYDTEDLAESLRAIAIEARWNLYWITQEDAMLEILTPDDDDRNALKAWRTRQAAKAGV